MTTPPTPTIDALITSMATPAYRHILTSCTVNKEPAFTPEQVAMLEACRFSQTTPGMYRRVSEVGDFCAIPDADLDGNPCLYVIEVCSGKWGNVYTHDELCGFILLTNIL